jgi:hypothetical protein
VRLLRSLFSTLRYLSWVMFPDEDLGTFRILHWRPGSRCSRLSATLSSTQQKS